jgi:hypothetical protein
MRQARGTAPLSRLSICGLAAILLIVLGGQAFALDPSRQLSQYMLDDWQMPEGLPQSSVQALAPTFADRTGRLWSGSAAAAFVLELSIAPVAESP